MLSVFEILEGKYTASHETLPQGLGLVFSGLGYGVEGCLVLIAKRFQESTDREGGKFQRPVALGRGV